MNEPILTSIAEALFKQNCRAKRTFICFDQTIFFLFFLYVSKFKNIDYQLKSGIPLKFCESAKSDTSEYAPWAEPNRSPSYYKNLMLMQNIFFFYEKDPFIVLRYCEDDNKNGFDLYFTRWAPFNVTMITPLNRFVCIYTCY